ncbi:MAG: hypothetical protein JW894_13620 [Bacteroidales bacterium]|nr:hypothetical protein [Bacteroidales bacterium]
MMKITLPNTEPLIIFFFFFLFMSNYGICQNLRISNNTILHNSAGSMIIKANIVNEGSYLNNGNTTILTGGSYVVAGTTPVTFNDLIIDEGTIISLTTPGQTLYGILLCNGEINSDGNLTLISTASQTALIDGSGTGEVNGNVTMQRYLASGFGYKYYCSPFQASQVSEFSDNMKLEDPFPAFYRYDESSLTSGWVTYVDPAGLLNPLEGYAINFGSSSSPITFDVTGVVNNGSLSRTLYNHNNLYSKGFSLTGNPYPSPIDWDAANGWTRINIDDAIYYFEASSSDEYGGSYVTYLNGVSSNGTASNIIPSMQGFFVHVTDGSWPVTGTLAMNNDVRIMDLTHPLIKSGLSTRSLLRLTAEFADDTLSVDPVVIYFDEKATFNFDGQLDALKLMNTDWFVTNLYAIASDGRYLSIDALPPTQDTLIKVPLGIRINRDGNIIFRIRTLEGEMANKEIYIYDAVTNSEHDLLSGKDYRIDLTEGEYNERFFLNLHSLYTKIIDIPYTKDNLFKIYSYKGILKLQIWDLPGPEGTLSLWDLSGRLLLIRKFYEPGSYEILTTLKTGIYIASFYSGTTKSSVKLVL